MSFFQHPQALQAFQIYLHRYTSPQKEQAMMLAVWAFIIACSSFAFIEIMGFGKPEKYKILGSRIRPLPKVWGDQGLGCDIPPDAGVYAHF